jgi:putative phage-type endonuclease
MHLEDLAVRATGIGGTAIGAIVGEHPFKRPIQLYRELTEPRPVDDDDREILAWGQDLEPLVLRRYERRTGYVAIGGMRSLRSRANPWQTGTPDGLVYLPETMMLDPRNPRNPGALELIPVGRRIDTVELAVGGDAGLVVPDRMLEIKTHGFYVGQQYGDEDTDDVPPYILAQTTWYLGMLGIERADLAVLSNTHTFRVFSIRFEPKLYERLLEAGHRFWHHNVLKRIEPEPDGSEAFSDWLDHHRKSDLTGEVVATEDLAELVACLRSARTSKKSAEALEKLYSQQIKMALGGAEVLRDDRGNELAIWKRNLRGNVSWKDVAIARAMRLGMTDLEIEDENERARGAPARPLRLKGANE